VLRDRHGRRLRPVGPASLKKLTETLAAILDEAIEDEYIELNPARGRRMRVLANRFDVLWVRGQVGHANSKMTMDVYAQLQQRVKREHGMAFDRLVDQAREQL
jgi:hypothetical protein